MVSARPRVPVEQRVLLRRFQCDTRETVTIWHAGVRQPPYAGCMKRAPPLFGFWGLANAAKSGRRDALGLQRRYMIFAISLTCFCTPGCALFRDPAIIPVVHRGKSAPISIVLDSPEVRRGVASEESRQEKVDQPWRDPHSRAVAERQFRDQVRYPEHRPPGQGRFFEAMARAPRVRVKGNTHVRVLEISKARCDSARAESTVSYIRVLVLNGLRRDDRLGYAETLIRCLSSLHEGASRPGSRPRLC
jgi:hypothetical protein